MEEFILFSEYNEAKKRKDIIFENIDRYRCKLSINNYNEMEDKIINKIFFRTYTYYS